MLRSCREYGFPPWDPFSTKKQKQSRTAIKKLDSEPLKNVKSSRKASSYIGDVIFKSIVSLRQDESPLFARIVDFTPLE